MPSSWLAIEAAGTVTRISSACSRQAQPVFGGIGQLHLGAPLARNAVKAADLAAGRARAAGPDEVRGLFQEREMRGILLFLGRRLGGQALGLAEQDRVAVRVDELGLAAERVRRIAQVIGLRARPADRADQRVEVVHEEVEQQKALRERTLAR
jgi:hypothetical protein